MSQLFGQNKKCDKDLCEQTMLILRRHCHPPQRNPNNVAETMVNMESLLYTDLNYAQQLNAADSIYTSPLGPLGRLVKYSFLNFSNGIVLLYNYHF